MNKQSIKKEEILNKKSIVILFRWIIILIASVLVYYRRGGFEINDPAVLILIFLTLSNGGITFIKQTVFEQPKYIFAILFVDIIAISFLFRYISSEQHLYLIFFAVLFISSISQNIKWSVLIATVASIIYLTLVTFRNNSEVSKLLLTPETAIKIPFIFLTAIWTSFWSEQYRRKKEEEEKIKKFNKELEKGIEEAVEKEKMITEELKIMKEYNENILKSLNSGIIVVNKNGKVTTINPKAEKILGINPDNVLDHTFFEIEELEPFQNELSEVLRKGNNKGIHEVKLKDGKILNTTYSVLKESNKNNGANITFQDITNIKKMEEKVKRSKNLANLGKTIGWIAHETRNSLTNILGYAQLIEIKFKNNQLLKKYLSGLIESTETLSVLMTDILDFSKDRSIKKDVVYIHKLFEQIEKEFSNSMNGTKLIINKNQNTSKILCNYEALRCVISNLIRNSKEAIDEIDTNGIIKLNYHRNNNNNILEIIDTAGGIKQEKLSKIFNPFYTTKENGTGLGLSIVKKIIESLDGNISVESKLGEGTKFRISLPSKIED